MLACFFICSYIEIFTSCESFCKSYSRCYFVVVIYSDMQLCFIGGLVWCFWKMGVSSMQGINHTWQHFFKQIQSNGDSLLTQKTQQSNPAISLSLPLRLKFSDRKLWVTLFQPEPHVQLTAATAPVLLPPLPPLRGGVGVHPDAKQRSQKITTTFHADLWSRIS